MTGAIICLTNNIPDSIICNTKLQNGVLMYKSIHYHAIVTKESSCSSANI